MHSYLGLVIGNWEFQFDCVELGDAGAWYDYLLLRENEKRSVKILYVVLWFVFQLAFVH